MLLLLLRCCVVGVELVLSGLKRRSCDVCMCCGKFEWIELSVFVEGVFCSWAGLGAGSWLTVGRDVRV